MAQRLIEITACLVQELHHALFTNLCTQCQRVDKHSHCVADAQVGTPVTDGGDAQLLIVGKPCQRVEGGGKQVVCRRDVMLMTELLNGIEIQRCIYSAYGALIQRIGKVGRYFRCALYIAQSLLEETVSVSIFLTAFSGFLSCNEVSIGEGLGFYLLTVEQVKQLRQQDIERTAVHNEVVNIHHQIDCLFGCDNLYVV